jgi:hypothetical protein
MSITVLNLLLLWLLWLNSVVIVNIIHRDYHWVESHNMSGSRWLFSMYDIGFCSEKNFSNWVWSGANQNPEKRAPTNLILFGFPIFKESWISLMLHDELCMLWKNIFMISLWFFKWKSTLMVFRFLSTTHFLSS